MASKLDGVLPLDDGRLLDLARPATGEGEVRLDPARVWAREDFMVRQALATAPWPSLSSAVTTT